MRVEKATPRLQAETRQGPETISAACGRIRWSIFAVVTGAVAPWEGMGADDMSTTGWYRSRRGERGSDSERLGLKPIGG